MTDRTWAIMASPEILCSEESSGPKKKQHSEDSRLLGIPFSTRILPFLFFSLLLQAKQISGIEMDICKERSCYPATGNLLLGRENRLSTTSTCGMVNPERYCIVSHLEDVKKCFLCDSRAPYVRYSNERSHRIENIVTERFEMRTKKWWQSENGAMNVSVRLDLEAEFYFTHLVITFKSFRPAAMLIEKSDDFGKSWKVYRYFAYDCAESFPDIPEQQPQRHTDVICTSRYSDVAPSAGGEVVFKVLSPHIPTKNPYAEEIQDLLRITNLRINFTKLHTLGDDLLDYRPEIDEKYYYAIFDMVVRGSCSCYGHAMQCVPIKGNGIAFVNQRPDMVHGQCECAHHTKGLNCEECEDFYNDLPWRPAIDRNINECKRCNCNSHASRCHFDRGVYEASGYVTGGVCDDCMHNTMGTNCEQCKPYYYKDPNRDISDPYICLPCQCDLRGALNEGICDTETDEDANLVAGRCHCKGDVDGERCDRCKNGFWDLSDDNPQGCKPCTCYLTGTVGNQGCDKYTGSCTCKRLVTGDNCDQCLPEHYGMSEEPDGCKACDCDIGGAYDNDCDITTGQCRCRPHFTGRRCEKPESGFFCANVDYYTFEAENAKIRNGDTELREPHSDGRRTWTGTGFARAREGSQIIFNVDRIALSMKYNLVIRYETLLAGGWQNVEVDVVRAGLPDSSGPCSNVIPKDDFLRSQLAPGGRYIELQPPVCLERGVTYEVRLRFGDYQTGYPDRSASLLIDSIIMVPPTDELSIFTGSSAAEYRRREYDQYQCRHQALSLSDVDRMSDVCRRYLCPVAAVIFETSLECNCDPTGSKSGICAEDGGQCECKENVIGKRCDRCDTAKYGFGPQGCKSCDCHSVGALNSICDLATGQCVCREAGIYGRQCDQCQPGKWGFPDCRPCECNGHADICDQKTGACIDCREETSGHYCDRCRNGYYGDPRLGVDIACRECPCPGGPTSGYQHADTCYLEPATQSVTCNCNQGYEGTRCDSCSMNYWGNPSEVGGSCVQCDCNGNINLNDPGSCDQTTGECLKCLWNTEGFQCEHCVSGYHGDAKTRTCRECVCNSLGTNSTVGPCDRASGQCPCLPNVEGVTCDQCSKTHWNIASGTGCEACACDPNGVIEDANGPILQCNLFDGQCPCKQGRGGRTCSDCQDLYWGDPTLDNCERCECDPTGSREMQCHRNNGTCKCNEGSGGPRCDQCARGYTGQWPRCHPCGECFQNWDKILQGLIAETNELIFEADNIEDTGVASVHDDKFEAMEERLQKVKAQLDTANITRKDVDNLQSQIDSLEKQIKGARKRLTEVDEKITEMTANVDAGGSALENLEMEAEEVEAKVKELDENATKLREADSEGAYNITRESSRKSQLAKQRADATQSEIGRSESARRQAEELLDRNQKDFEQQFQENQEALEELDTKVEELENKVPKLNNLVCGGSGEKNCDDLCGGPGCGSCGGASCNGSVTKAEKALDFADKAAKVLQQKQTEANELLRRLKEAQFTTQKAEQDAIRAFEDAKRTADRANQTKVLLEEKLKQIETFLAKNASSPEEIRTRAEETLKLKISQTPEQIRGLAEQIRDRLAKLSNIGAILEETRGNLTLAQDLKRNADSAKARAERVKNTTDAVVQALEKAREAQNSARNAIDKAKGDIDTTQDNLGTIRDATEQAEKAGNDSKTSLDSLKEKVNDVRVKYVGMDHDVNKTAAESDKAMQKAKAAKEDKERLEKLYDQAKEELENKQGGNEVPKERASQLRNRATKLVSETEKFLDDINENKKSFDANEVRLGNYADELSDLHRKMDQCTQDIQKKLRFHETCDA